jgi:hypothetical protein
MYAYCGGSLREPSSTTWPIPVLGGVDFDFDEGIDDFPWQARLRRFQIERCEKLVGRRAQVFANDLRDDVCGHRDNFRLQLRQFFAIDIRHEISSRRKRLSKLDKQGPEFLAGPAKMFGACPITRLVLDEFIVDDANAVARKYGQDLSGSARSS